jgi:hypothetical protein
MNAQVVSYTGLQKVLDFFVPFDPSESNIKIGEYEFGNIQAQRPGHLAADQFGNKRLLSLTGTAKLQHIHKSIIGLNQTWK